MLKINMILLQVLSKGREDLTKHKLQEEVQELCETEKISKSEKHVLNNGKCGDS